MRNAGTRAGSAAIEAGVVRRGPSANLTRERRRANRRNGKKPAHEASSRTSRSRAVTADRPLLGILLMLGFCVLAPMGDAAAKALGGVIAVGHLVAIRFLFQAGILLPVARATGRGLRLPPHIMRLLALRTALHIVGISAMFLALRHLPLAEALAIAFVMPFILLLLGWAVLGEEVGPRRLIACAVGFSGTLMVIQPTFAEVGPPALLPLVVAVVFSLFMLITRRIAKEVDAVTMQAVSGLMASTALLPLFLIVPFDFSRPAAGDWALVALLGIVGTLAHLLITWSLRYAPSATVAPMQYLEIPFGTLIGWLAFGDFPNGLALAGIAVTIAAGLYIVFRERAISRPAPAQT